MLTTLEKGMKIKLVKPFEILGTTVGTVGAIYTITDIIGDNMIFFESENGNGTVTMNNFDEYFEMYVEPAETEYVEFIAPTVTYEHIDSMLEESDISISTVYGTCTIVSVKLPNNYVITEHCTCQYPEDCDEEAAVDICMERIRHKIWELENYKLKCELYEACLDCECDECCGACFDEEI